MGACGYVSNSTLSGVSAPPAGVQRQTASIRRGNFHCKRAAIPLTCFAFRRGRFERAAVGAAAHGKISIATVLSPNREIDHVTCHCPSLRVDEFIGGKISVTRFLVEPNDDGKNADLTP